MAPSTAASVEIWESASLEEHVSLIQRQFRRSLRDGELRQLAAKIVSNKPDDFTVDPRTGLEIPVVIAWGEAFRLPQAALCGMKDDKCESQALWDFMILNTRYVLDPDGYDLFMTAKRALQSGALDCFVEGTLLLRDDHTLIPVEYVQPGMKIWGLDRWSEVQAAWPKGVLPVSLVHLNNGSTLKLTEDHHVYVLHCPKHVNRKTRACSCPVEAREELRVRVCELEPGMVLPQPKTVPFGTINEDPRISLLEGLYVADGWVQGGNQFFISGLDGGPKEAQKRLVAEICEELGYPTTWHRKHIAVTAPELMKRFLGLGGHAPQKRVSTLRLAEPAARELLRGLMADSGANTHGQGRTFTTTSRKLALTVRLLHRMLGISCGYKYIEDHGGLGTNAIHRLSTRQPGAEQEKLLRVKAIDREVLETPCWDITTDDHRVYLPEHDVTVSQCDDYVITLGALHKMVGFQNLRARVVSTNGKYWEHIYLLVGFPKTGQVRQWMPLDPTVPGAIPGWQYDKIKAYQDFEL